MKLVKMKIEKLFDQFDYSIPMDNADHLLILTGPNGFGKTMILNILHSFFNKRFFFFQKLVFGSITLEFEEGLNVLIQKATDDGKTELRFSIIAEGEEIDTFTYPEKGERESSRTIDTIFPFMRRMGNDRWIDLRSNRIFSSLDEVIVEYSDQLPENIKLEYLGVTSRNKTTLEIFDSTKVHLIREQRLFRRVTSTDSDRYPEANRTYMTDTIREFAKELQQLISGTLQNSFQVSQQLDSSFPRRLLSERGRIAIDDFNKRFKILREMQDKLRKYGLSPGEQDVPNYDEANSKVLLVYLNDSERKLSVFDDLLLRLELFTNILNERRFTFKSIRVDKERGLFFLTNKGKDLNLTDLSSGEQHEVVLLFELIFKARPNTLVLIDEPELSLHVTWQKEFLNDLLRIINLQGMRVLIATHSPQIINDRWDLVFNLEAQDSL